MSLTGLEDLVRSWVILLSGSMSALLPTRTYETGMPGHHVELSLRSGWVALANRIIAEMGSAIGASQDSSIVYDRRGTLTSTTSEIMPTEVVLGVPCLFSLSQIIETAQDMFRALDFVRDVKAVIIKPGRAAVLSVFALMPSYDYDKMMEFVRVQQRVDEMAEEHGYEVDAVLLPLPHVDPGDVVTVRPSTYLE